MTRYYELMDLDCANVVGLYEVEEEALVTVRYSLERYGAAGVEGLAMSVNTVNGGGRLIAEGEEPARLATAGDVFQRG